MKTIFQFFGKTPVFVNYIRILASLYNSRNKFNACYFSVSGFFYAFYRKTKCGTIPPCKLVMGLLFRECKAAGKVVPFFFYTAYNKFNGTVLLYKSKFVTNALSAHFNTHANAKFWQFLNPGQHPPVVPPINLRIVRSITRRSHQSHNTALSWI
jgi:hypothetical protein